MACNPASYDPTMPLEKCESFVFDKSTLTSTLTTENDLVCDKSYQVNRSIRDKSMTITINSCYVQPKFLGTLWMVGVFIGSLLGGPLSDKLGRALTSKLMISVIGPSIAAIGFTQGYLMFALAHALSLVFNSAIWISSITHIVELSNKNVRVKVMLYF